jgi:hypothetical protein
MRARRDGKWQSLDIAELTREELTETFKAADKDRVIMFLAAVTQWMRENLVEAPSLCKHGLAIQECTDCALHKPLAPCVRIAQMQNPNPFEGMWILIPTFALVYGLGRLCAWIFGP